MSFWKDLFKSKEQEKTGLVFIVEDNESFKIINKISKLNNHEYTNVYICAFVDFL